MFAIINDVRIHYRIFGESGPVVIAMSGGREPIVEILEFGRTLGQQGFRVILYERRNCGKSSLDFKTSGAEEDIWANDLCGLMDHLGIEKGFIVGRSRSARVGINFALLNPDRILGLAIWGVGGSQAVVRFLVDYYFDQYITACKTGGMVEVVKLGHFAQLISCVPSRSVRLENMNPIRFLTAIQRWKMHFLEHANAPVMGLPDDVLQRVTVPTALIPKYDRLHPIELLQYVHERIAESVLFDFRPDLHGTGDNIDDQGAVAKIAAGFFQDCLIKIDVDGAR